MTTAHRPTFDPARGKEAQRGPAYHQRLLPAHTTLKHRQPGQGGDIDGYKRDLRAELLEAEARHFAKKNGTYVEPETATEPGNAPKRQIDAVAAEEGDEGDEADQKRRRIEMLEKFREVDADDSSSESDSSDDEYAQPMLIRCVALLTSIVTKMKKMRRQLSCANWRKLRKSALLQKPKKRQSALQKKTNSARSMSHAAIRYSMPRTSP